MLPPWEWTESDILGLITNQVQESLTLDYKACDALGRTDGKKREISKDVSAFANSAGGQIVYGVIEDKHFPTKIDVGYNPGDISKEWVEQVINTNIQRRIDGVRINQVQLTGQAPGKVLYVVSIPQSVRAPHMAADHRFYKRFNFESVHMEEYEVRDVARRSETPNLRVACRLPISAPPLVELLASITNDAPEPATHIVIRIYIDDRVVIIDAAGMARLPHPESIVGGLERVSVTVLYKNWASPPNMPVWEGAEFRITDSDLRLRIPPGPGNYTIGWEVRTPRMSTKTGFYTLRSDGAGATLTAIG